MLKQVYDCPERKSLAWHLVLSHWLQLGYHQIVQTMSVEIEQHMFSQIMLYLILTNLQTLCWVSEQVTSFELSALKNAFLIVLLWAHSTCQSSWHTNTCPSFNTEITCSKYEKHVGSGHQCDMGVVSKHTELNTPARAVISDASTANKTQARKYFWMIHLYVEPLQS